jgi:hypothetical protein
MAKRSRRTFLQGMAGAPLLISAAENAPAQESTSPFTAQADALAQVIQLRYGQFLTEGDMPEIKRGIERMLRNAETIGKIKITNADEPDFMFHPSGSL